MSYEEELIANHQLELSIAKRTFQDKSLKTICEGVKKFYKRLDKQISKNIEEYSIKLACKEGCSHCCNLRVEVFGYEITAIAKYINDTFPNDKKRTLLLKLEDISKQAVDLQIEDYSLQCAMIEDNKCMIYEMRPAMCRKASSLRVDTCIAKNAGDENKVLFQTTVNALQGFVEGARQAGLRHDLFELNSALYIALSNYPAASKNWIQGLTVFKPVPENADFKAAYK